VNDDFEGRAAELDAADPLAEYRGRFLVPAGSDVVAYFDGNSLGRPVRAAAERMARFVGEDWGGRLIRGWDEGWLHWPEELGDRLGAVALGAAPGQTVVADSTTVLLYKLARAAVDARPGRTEILIDTDNFPTDRYVLEGIAAERGLTLRWVETDPEAGITLEEIERALSERVALVVLSHVAYRSGWIADAAAITRAAHAAGALILWDLCHSAGVVPVELDAWGADVAVGCSYKYLNGGPGAPAFGYLRRNLQPGLGTTEDVLQQPIWGWMGRHDSFAMAPGYVPAPGVRGVLSGTPPILAMVPLLAGVELLAEAGIAAVREKSLQLTDFALEQSDAELAPLGARLVSPRAPARRGGHITLRRAGFRDVLADLWRRGVIPDYRDPDGIRIGLSPLSTSFAEVHRGMRIFRELAARA
jgi:kynureninase